MRIFKDLYEMYSEVEREIRHNGQIVKGDTVQDKDVKGNDEYTSKELIGYSFLIKSTHNRDEWLEKLGKNLEWAKMDFQERTCGERVNPGQAYLLRSCLIHSIARLGVKFLT